MESAAIATRERDLRSLLSELRESLDASPLAVVHVDPEGIVTEWNKGAERLFGWSDAEVLGLPLPTVPDDRRSEFELVRDRQRGGESFAGYRTGRRRKDGTHIDVAVWSTARFDAEGRFLFGRLLGREDGRLHILPLEAGARQQVVADPAWIAKAVRLVRPL
jgi:PAS domain S-box-containing protein